MLQAQLTISLAGQKLSVSIFMLDGLLIDTGPHIKRVELIRLLADWEFTDVILTHHHEDHTGLAHWIQKHKNTPIYIHELGVSDCEKNGKMPLYRRAFWGRRDRKSVVREKAAGAFSRRCPRGTDLSA